MHLHEYKIVLNYSVNMTLWVDISLFLLDNKQKQQQKYKGTNKQKKHSTILSEIKDRYNPGTSKYM